MGLEVGYFRRIRQVVPVPSGSRKHDQHVMFTESDIHSTERGWPGFSDGIVPGVYSFSESGDFSAGGYANYDEWRDHLARLAHGNSQEPLPKNAGGPFEELLGFADDGGVIGATVAAKLARDFADFEDRAVAYADVNGIPEWLQLYREFEKAFTTASDGGAVFFY